MTDYQSNNNTTRAVCAQCGLPYEQTGKRQRICPECYYMNQRRAKAKWTKEHRRKLKEQGEQTNTPEPKPKPIPKGTREDPNRHVCTWSKSCEYGTPHGEDFNCNYFTANEGKLRTAGGLHLIENGKCDLYKRRTRNRSGWQRERDGKLEKENRKNDE